MIEILIVSLWVSINLYKWHRAELVFLQKNNLGNESNIFLLEIKLSNLQKINIKVTRLK